MLGGRCRYCTAPISWLYPFIELLTTAALGALYLTVPTHYFVSYFIFFSALIVTIRSDLESMLISRFATLFLVPLGFTLSLTNQLPITVTDSLLGCVVGYFFLYITAKIFYWITGVEGMGQGDLELLAFIGSFTGLVGCWFSLMLGSIIGSMVGISYIVATKSSQSFLKFLLGLFWLVVLWAMF